MVRLEGSARRELSRIIIESIIRGECWCACGFEAHSLMRQWYVLEVAERSADVCFHGRRMPFSSGRACEFEVL